MSKEKETAVTERVNTGCDIDTLLGKVRTFRNSVPSMTKSNMPTARQNFKIPEFPIWACEMPLFVGILRKSRCQNELEI